MAVSPIRAERSMTGIVLIRSSITLEERGGVEQGRRGGRKIKVSTRTAQRTGITEERRETDRILGIERDLI